MISALLIAHDTIDHDALVLLELSPVAFIESGITKKRRFRVCRCTARFEMSDRRLRSSHWSQGSQDVGVRDGIITRCC